MHPIVIWPNWVKPGRDKGHAPLFYWGVGLRLYSVSVPELQESSYLSIFSIHCFAMKCCQVFQLYSGKLLATNTQCEGILDPLRLAQISITWLHTPRADDQP